MAICKEALICFISFLFDGDAIWTKICDVDLKNLKQNLNLKDFAETREM